MNLIDVFVIIIILAGAVIGFKNGFTKQIVSFIGFIIVIVLSYLLKNYVSDFLYQFLPFFKFGGALKGVTVLNIALYEVIAFFIVFSILMIGFRIVLFISKVFETLLKFTIILGIPSKLLGALVGLFEYYIIAFMVLYALTLPIFNIEGMDNSKLKDPILKNTPVLSGYTKNGVEVFDEFKELKTKYESNTDANSFNLETLDLFLKYNFVKPESVNKLIKLNKLDIKNVDSVLNKYK